jgi:hypothetical protein
MNATYIGSLPCGELLDPATGITYPFTRGEPITLPDTLVLPASDWQLASARAEESRSFMKRNPPIRT